jgi:citrate synthase
MNIHEWLGITATNETEHLLGTLAKCHKQAALNNQNASSMALQISAACGMGFEHSVASALMTFGAKHGPVSGARKIIYHTSDEDLDKLIEDGEIIPGWGNDFHKTSVDPAFAEMNHLLKMSYTEHADKLDHVTERIFKVKGRVLYPNPAAFNSVVCEIAGLANGIEMLLPIAFRLPAWAQQYLGTKGHRT